MFRLTIQFCSFHKLVMLCSISVKLSVRKFQMHKLCLEKKERNQRANCQCSLDHRESKGIPEKHLVPSLSTLKPLTVWITTNCGKFWKRWEYQTSFPASWEICMQVKKQQLEPNMEHGLVPNWERSTSRLYTVTLFIYRICRIHHVKCWAGWSWNQDCWEKYQSPQICKWHHRYGRKWRRTKEPLDESERGEWKSWLQAQHSEN